MAHKCNMWQLFAIPASYENNIALVKPEGSYVHAQMLPLFRQPFFSLALYLCAAKFFFRFFCYLIEFCCPLVCSCSHYRLRGNLLEAFGRQTGSEKDFITSWRVAIPLPSNPLFRLWPTSCFSLCSIAFFCSALPLSVSLPSHSSSLSSLPSALDVTSSGNYQRKPGPMATPFPATSTCPISHSSPLL